MLTNRQLYFVVSFSCIVMIASTSKPYYSLRNFNTNLPIMPLLGTIANVGQHFAVSWPLVCRNYPSDLFMNQTQPPPYISFNLTTFYVTNAGTGCLPIYIETLYYLIPPLIIATDSENNRYYGVGNLIIYKNHTLNLKVEIVTSLNGSGVLIDKVVWYTLGMSNTTNNTYLVVQPSTNQNYIVPNNGTILISTSHCFPTVYRITKTGLIHRIPTYTTIAFGEIYSGLYYESVFSGDTISMVYDYVPANSIYSFKPCNVSVHMTTSVPSYLKGIPQTYYAECNINGKTNYYSLGLQFKLTDNIITLKDDTLINENCKVYFNASLTGEIMKVEDSINYSQIHDLFASKSLLGIELDNIKRFNHGKCIDVEQWTLDDNRNIDLSFCNDLRTKRCSYNQDCIFSFPNYTLTQSCNTRTNRCNISVFDIINCTLHKVSTKRINQLVAMTNSNFTQLPNIIAGLFQSPISKRGSVSYSINNKYSIIVSDYIKPQTTHQKITRYEYEPRRQCNLLDSNFAIACGNNTRNYCVNCDGNICILDPTIPHPYCNALARCYTSLNVPNSTQTQSLCLSLSSNFSSSCIINGIVSSCNSSSIITAYNSVIFDYFNQIDRRETNVIIPNSQIGNLPTFLGQNIPLRLSTYSYISDRYPLANINTDYDWEAMYLYIAGIDTLADFYSRILKDSDNTTLHYYDSYNIDDNNLPIRITNNINFTLQAGSVDLYVDYQLTRFKVAALDNSVINICDYFGCNNINITNSTELLHYITPNLCIDQNISVHETKIIDRPITYDILFLNTNMVIFNSSSAKIIVLGDLSMTNTTVLNINKKNTSIVVGGCLNLAGTLDVTNITYTANSNITLIEHSGCVNGTFDYINLPVSDSDTCQYSDIAYNNRSITLIFTDTNIICGITLYIVIGVICVIVIVIVIIVVIYFKVKSIREKIAPFHDRKYWEKSKTTNVPNKDIHPGNEI